MPLAQAKPFRQFIYGAPKSRKTLYAGFAAEAGFNVLLFDCDRGSSVLRCLSTEAQARIHHFDISDYPTRSHAAVEIAQFIRIMQGGQPFFFNCASRQFGQVQPPPTVAHYKLHVQLLTTDDILVLDSWTAYNVSLALRYNNENNIDPAEAAKPEWEGFRWCGAVCEFCLSALSTLPCNLLVIGHQDIWEKKKSVMDNRGRPTEITEFTRIQPKAASRPAALQLAKYFDDMLYFRVNTGQTFIDASADALREGGARCIPTGTYQFDKLTFAQAAAAYGIAATGQASKGCTYVSASP